MAAMTEIIAVAVIIPVLSVTAVWAAKRIGRWLMHSISHSFGEVVHDVMAPDMAHLGTRVASSLDDLTAANTRQHAEVDARLGTVEGRLSDVEHRLAAVEDRLGIRPPDARTRSTDKEQTGAD